MLQGTGPLISRLLKEAGCSEDALILTPVNRQRTVGFDQMEANIGVDRSRLWILTEGLWCPPSSPIYQKLF